MYSKARIDFENRITNDALESGLELGTVVKALATVQYRFQQAGKNLADQADVRKALEYSDHKLIITVDSHVQA